MTSKTERRQKREKKALGRAMREVWRKERGGEQELVKAQIARYGSMK